MIFLLFVCFTRDIYIDVYAAVKVVLHLDTVISVTCDVESSASLYTRAESNLGDRALDEIEEDSFVTLPGKGGHRGLLPQKTVSPPRRI